MQYNTIYHIKADSTNRFKKTLCGLSYEGRHFEIAYPKDIFGKSWETILGGPIEKDEICKRCLKVVHA